MANQHRLIDVIDASIKNIGKKKSVNIQIYRYSKAAIIIFKNYLMIIIDCFCFFFCEVA